MSLKGAAAPNVRWPDTNARPWGGFGGGPGGPNVANRQPPKTYAERVQELKNFFAEARAYRDAVKAGQTVRSDVKYAAMIPALDGQIPVVVAADGVARVLMARGRKTSARIANEMSRLLRSRATSKTTKSVAASCSGWNG